MFGLFRREPLFDSVTTEWLLHVFAWSLEQVEDHLFFSETPLVLPTEAFFPGRADSVQGMAELIFSQVSRYAGMAHWPWVVVDGAQPLLFSGGLLSAKMELRREMGGSALAAAAERLPVPYDPALVRTPEALIAGFAHTLAHYRLARVAAPLPGGEENRPHIEELVGVFFGFGVMFANSAYVAPARSCGSCAVPQRSGYLSQHHLSYALALFCQLKEIPVRQVLPHLKPSLRGYFKRAVREVAGYAPRLARSAPNPSATALSER